MNTQKYIRLLISLAFLAVFSLGTLKAETTPSASDTANIEQNISTSAEEATSSGQAPEEEPTRPLTIPQFDEIRAIMAQEKANSDSIQKRFQAWLDNILGTTTADQATDSAK